MLVDNNNYVMVEQSKYDKLLHYQFMIMNLHGYLKNHDIDDIKRFGHIMSLDKENISRIVGYDSTAYQKEYDKALEFFNEIKGVINGN